MNLQKYQLFVQLCESILLEKSSLNKVLGRAPGSNIVLQYIHVNWNVPHDQEFERLHDFNFDDEIRQKYSRVIILVYKEGVGAIRFDDDSDSNEWVFANTDNLDDLEGAEESDYTAPKFYEELKNPIVYAAYYSNPRSRALMDKIRKRKNEPLRRMGKAPLDVQRKHLEKLSRSTTYNEKNLLAKFKPLWVKYIKIAMGELKEISSRMLQNDAFSKAQDKLDKMCELNQILDELDDGELRQIPGVLKSAMDMAITLSGKHHYPNEDPIQCRYSLLLAIRDGDQKQLSTVLHFFKKVLIYTS
jgi:hypothetical protein